MKTDFYLILLVVILVILAGVSFVYTKNNTNYSGRVNSYLTNPPTKSNSSGKNTFSTNNGQITTYTQSLEDLNNKIIKENNSAISTVPSSSTTYLNNNTTAQNTNNSQTQIRSCNNTPLVNSRDMWVWHDNTEIIRSGTQAQNDLFTFVDSHNIRTIYLNLTTSFFDDSTNVANLKTFLNTAKNSHCLNVEALNGDPSWATNITSATNWARAVVNFNSTISGSTKLIGLQFDVEPFNSSSGSDITIGNSYIDMLEAVKNIVSVSGLIFDTAIPRWYDTKTSLVPFVRNGATGKSLMQYVVDNVDTITIMDYVTDSSSMYNDAKGELDYASQTGKKVRIGLDATDYTSCSQMNNIISGTYNMLTGSDLGSFDGFSIEHYKGTNNTLASYSLLCK